MTWLIDTKNRGKPRWYWEQSISLQASLYKEPPLVLVTPKSTSTQHKFIKSTSPHITTMETSPKSKPKTYQNLTLLSEAFRARAFQSQESGEVSQILGELFSSTSPESLKLNNLAYYSLKTSKGFYLTTKATHSELSSQPLMNWGMTSNGKCLTARISASPRIGKECSLSDILEEHPDQKYFLSDRVIKSMIRFEKSKIKKGQGHRVLIHDTASDGRTRPISECQKPPRKVTPKRPSANR